MRSLPLRPRRESSISRRLLVRELMVALGTESWVTTDGRVAGAPNAKAGAVAAPITMPRHSSVSAARITPTRPETGMIGEPPKAGRPAEGGDSRRRKPRYV